MLTNRLYIYHIREKWKNMLDKNLKGKGKASNTYIAEQNIFTYKGNALNNKNDISPTEGQVSYTAIAFSNVQLKFRFCLACM